MKERRGEERRGKGRKGRGHTVAETGRAAVGDCAADGFAAAEGCAIGALVSLLRGAEAEEGEDEGEEGDVEGEVHFRSWCWGWGWRRERGWGMDGVSCANRFAWMKGVRSCRGERGRVFKHSAVWC